MREKKKRRRRYVVDESVSRKNLSKKTRSLSFRCWRSVAPARESLSLSPFVDRDEFAALPLSRRVRKKVISDKK
jgi:hypothetical protein